MGIQIRWSVWLVAMIVSASAAATEVVTVAAEDDWAPYSSIKADQSGPQGIAPKLVTAVFKTQGIDVRYLVVPFSRCLHYAEKGTVVGCFDTTRTEANKDRFYWHPTPLFREELGIFARADMPNRELVAKDLEGHTVGVTIGYSRNALSMLAAHHFDVVLMDCQMPGMDGYTATRRIRQMPQWQALPVIAMTANAMLGDREKALACDMNDHVAKPIDVEDLYRVLSKWSRPDAGIA